MTFFFFFFVSTLSLLFSFFLSLELSLEKSETFIVQKFGKSLSFLDDTLFIINP